MFFSSIIPSATVDCRQIDSTSPPQEIRPYFRIIQGSWRLIILEQSLISWGGGSTPLKIPCFFLYQKGFFLQGPDSLSTKTRLPLKCCQPKCLAFCPDMAGSICPSAEVTWAMEVLGSRGLKFHLQTMLKWLHPGRLTWNMSSWRPGRSFLLSKWAICRFHVNLPGCIHPQN